MADKKYTLVYTGEEVDERLGWQDNIQLSTVPAEREKDQGGNETNQATIPGTLDGAIVCDVDNYYLHKAHVIAKTWTPIRSDSTATDTWTSSAEHEVFGIKNENGDFLVPYANGDQMNAGGNPLGGILCMASFLNRGITYGRDNSVFATSSSSTHDELVCSDYVFAGLCGISYNNSRANPNCGENFESLYKSRTARKIHSLLAPVDKDALITRELAYVFAANNALFELDYQYLSNLSVGDVLFFGIASPNNDALHNYMSIGHCAMVVDVDYANNRVYVLESGTASLTLLDYSFTEGKSSLEYTNEGTSPDSPCFNALRIFKYDNDQASSGNMTAYRRIYVGKPAWPNVSPRLVSSTTIEDAATETTAEYSSAWFTLQKSEANFKKGDIVVVRLTSNLNKLNNSGDTSGANFYMRVDGAYGSAPNVTSKALWLTYSLGQFYHIQNDRVMIFPIDDDVYTRLRVMIHSSNTGQTVTGTCTFDVYRL